MTQHDVGHEQHAVGEGEQVTQRLTRDPHVGQRMYARHGKQKRDQVAARPHAPGSDCDGAEEFDGTHGREWQPGNGFVEQNIHRREHHAKRDDGRLVLARLGGEETPGLAPYRKHQPGAGDPQPGYTGRRELGEQKHSERRTEIVEYGADEEVGVRWHAIRERRGGGRDRDGCIRGHTLKINRQP
ncbi:MAG: hypothetical protein QOF70_5289 [Acetobacteraceae bacterium]|nr:hypothetical protein [Acetobacteraceae bacterium]